jgi:hypothetical protein
MAETIERGGYRYIPGPFQYSAGMAALPGFARPVRGTGEARLKPRSLERVC